MDWMIYMSVKFMDSLKIIDKYVNHFIFYELILIWMKHIFRVVNAVRIRGIGLLVSEQVYIVTVTPSQRSHATNVNNILDYRIFVCFFTLDLLFSSIDSSVNIFSAKIIWG